MRAGHVCIHKKPGRRHPPELKVVDGSEIWAQIDGSAMGADGIFRPVLIEQDEGEVLALTLEDAQRLYDFLCEAIPYIEGKITRNN